MNLRIQINRGLLAALAVSCIVILSGCTTVREARKVQRDEVPRLPGEYTMPAIDAGIEAGAVLSLSQLEEIALKCSPSMLQSSLAVEQARISLANAKAGYLPTLSSSVGHSRSTRNTDRHSGTIHNNGAYNGGLNMSLTLYDFGRTSARVRQAQDSLAAALKEYDQRRSAIVYGVRQAYFELRRAIELHAVAVESVGQYSDHLEQMKVKREIGESIEYDVLKAEVDYQSARLEEISTANSVSTGWANLNLALGLAETPEYKLGDCNVREYQQDADELMATAREREPSLAALRYNVNVASGALDESIADLYPDLTFSLGGSVSGRNPALPWLWNLSSGISLGENIFNGGRTCNAIRQATISLQIARSRYAAAEQTMYRDIRSAVLNSSRAKQSQEVANLKAKSAERNLEITNEKFRNGKATSVDRTDAQVSLSSAKAQAVNAYFDYLEAQATIAKLIGE